MKIMLGYQDFSFNSNVIMTAIEHAKTFNAQLILVTSMAVGEDIPKENFDRAEENLEKAKAYFLDQGIDCTSRLIESGLSTGENLVQFAANHNVGELLIGVKNRSKLGKLIFGSTAQYVILNASCPVLSIKEE